MLVQHVKYNMIYYIITDFLILGNSNNNLKFRQSHLRNLKKMTLKFCCERCV